MSHPSAASLSERTPALLALLLVLATLLLYSPVWHHDFLALDDSLYVTRNVHVNSGLNSKNVVWAFTAFYEANWHPLTWLSHMTDCQLFGLRSGFHHLVNVVLHAANVLLLFWLLQRATGALWRSFLVAALFAVHPLNVETVAWVAQRKSLLCMLFCLITVALYGWYAGRPSWKRYVAVAAAFALALMSKPMAVSLPIALLLLDYWPLQRYPELPDRSRWLRLSLEKLPLAFMSAASSAVTLAAQRAGGAVADSSLPLSVRVGNAVISYAAYIQKTFLPTNLSVFYPHPQQSLPWSDVLAAGFILITITAAALYFRRYRYFVTGWFFFVATLVPVIGIVQVGRQAMADRYAYVPCIGLFIILVWGLNDIVSATLLPRVIPAIAALGLIMGFAIATTRYLPYWQNGVILMKRAEALAGPPDPGIEEFLADELAFVGRINEAYQHYGTTCILLPNYATCHYNLAEILLSRNQLRDALQQYQLAGTSATSQDMELSCLIKSGEILLDLGDYEAAGERLDAALRIDPTNNMALQLRQRAYNRSR